MKKRLTKRDFPSLTPADWQFIEKLESLPPELQGVFERLLRLLSNAKRSGDEFTDKRFLKLAQPGVVIDMVLAELERRPPAS